MIKLHYMGMPLFRRKDAGGCAEEQRGEAGAKRDRGDETHGGARCTRRPRLIANLHLRKHIEQELN